MTQPTSLHIGPCAVCTKDTNRYGMGGSPLCDTCAKERHDKVAASRKIPRES